MGTNFILLSLRGVFFVLFFLIISLSGTNAQNMYVGIKGGFNMSHINGTIEKPTFYDAANAGLFYTYILNKNFGFTGEAIYTMKGTRYYNGADFTTKRLNYIEIPLYCKYYIPLKWDNMRVKAFAGPAIAYLLSSKDMARDASDKFKKVDVGLLGGIGIVKPLFKEYSLSFDVRYQHGLLNISKLSNFKYSVGVLSFNLGLSMPICEKKEKSEK